jgi:hypothetical protein
MYFPVFARHVLVSVMCSNVSILFMCGMLMLHTINVVERVLTLLVMCLLHAVCRYEYYERSVGLVLFYVGGWGVCVLLSGTYFYPEMVAST